MQLQFWQWIADYYMCYFGDVMQAALPSAFKLAGESVIVINPDFDGDVSDLNEREYAVVQALQHKEGLSIAEISGITGLSKTIHLIKNLRDKNVILVKEELVERYRPRLQQFLRIGQKYRDEVALQALFDRLERRAFKQLQALMQFIHLITQQKTEELRREALLATMENKTDTGAVLRTMIKNGIFEVIERAENRLKDTTAVSHSDTICLSNAQQQTLDDIQQLHHEKSVVLLHGVTSSGKTEIYIKLIEQALQQGQQALYLLPEIALTDQIVRRLRKYFGKKVGIYHSRFNEQERIEIWNRVHTQGDDQFQIIIGARSAIFLPFVKLGLVIVDEEHDMSYKQYDPAPRYNARDTAIYLANTHQAKVLLGSATPSVESYFNATSGKYGLVTLTTRYGNGQLPEIRIADLSDEKRKQTLTEQFSAPLIHHIQQALEHHQQVILFQNRRGFSLRVECKDCGYIPVCDQCDVSLTYHKSKEQLQCHYCGMTARIPTKCPQCGGTNLTMKGFGTEKIEDDLTVLFPTATVRRMDLDTSRSRNAHQKILTEFENRKIDILVGTQMITKGLDFENVSLVGIVSADNLLYYPDFRAFERSFQLMSQVAGRAGRRDGNGCVIIQTFNKRHPVIQFVIQNDYQGLYQSQLVDRQQFKYPPYVRLP
ncbi:primosomal protein N' [Bacteroidia bacterium]|nr:primosomal protein N' [Bacteroidia bacterium]